MKLHFPKSRWGWIGVAAFFVISIVTVVVCSEACGFYTLIPIILPGMPWIFVWDYVFDKLLFFDYDAPATTTFTLATLVVPPFINFVIFYWLGVGVGKLLRRRKQSAADPQNRF